MKVVPSNADEFASHANKVVEDIKIIYQETSHISGTLKEALAIQVTDTQKVWMIKHTIGKNEVKLSFYAHKGTTDPFILKSYTTSSDSEGSNTMDSETAAAETLVSENVAVDSDPGTESFQIGCWYSFFQSLWLLVSWLCYWHLEQPTGEDGFPTAAWPKSKWVWKR